MEQEKEHESSINREMKSVKRKKEREGKCDKVSNSGQVVRMT